jgi:hypothetical protein
LDWVGCFNAPIRKRPALPINQNSGGGRLFVASPKIVLCETPQETERDLGVGVVFRRQNMSLLKFLEEAGLKEDVAGLVAKHMEDEFEIENVEDLKHLSRVSFVGNSSHFHAF